MLQILETKLWEIIHSRFGYTSYAPSYSSATPSFVKEKVPAPHLPITSPPYQVYDPHPTRSPPSHTGEEHPFLLPSKGEYHLTPPLRLPPFSSKL